MRLVFAGTPAPAVVGLEALLASRHEVVAVLTRPDAPAGRGRRLVASPVGEVARSHGLEVLTPASTRDPELRRRLVALDPDCCPVVAYGGLVPPDLLAVPRLGWVNLHFSLLPAWRGAAPVQHALLAGDDVTGATTFLLDAGLDTGAVLGMVTEQVRPTDTSADLLDRLSRSGAQLLVATLDGLEQDTLVPVPQPADGVSLAPKLTVDDARVDWTAPALRVDRLVRACTPAPGAWTTYAGERLRLGPVALGPVAAVPEAAERVPGALHVEKARVLVGTGSTPVALGWVQPAGRRPMAAADWARGLRLGAGERFGP